MGVIYIPGQELTRGDLQIFLSNSYGDAQNAAYITYAIYYVSPIAPYGESLWGELNRIPVNPAIGEYYASLRFPQCMTLGNYRIRWTFQKYLTYPLEQAVEEFGIVPGPVPLSSCCPCPCGSP
jgi:hypothetical protein